MTRTLMQHQADIVIDHRHRDDHDVERMVSALHRYQQRCASQSGKRTYNQSCRCASRSPPVHPSNYALLTDKQHTFAQAVNIITGCATARSTATRVPSVRSSSNSRVPVHQSARPARPDFFTQAAAMPARPVQSWTGTARSGM